MGIFHKRDVAVKAEKSVTVDDENVEAMEENCIVFHNTAFSTIDSVLVASPVLPEWSYFYFLVIIMTFFKK